jgi:hypothetical protein
MGLLVGDLSVSIELPVTGSRVTCLGLLGNLFLVMGNSSVTFVNAFNNG